LGPLLGGSLPLGGRLDAPGRLGRAGGRACGALARLVRAPGVRSRSLEGAGRRCARIGVRGDCWRVPPVLRVKSCSRGGGSCRGRVAAPVGVPGGVQVVGEDGGAWGWGCRSRRGGLIIKSKNFPPQSYLLIISLPQPHPQPKISQ